MPIYTYKSIDPHGKKYSGNLNARHEGEAKEKLRSQGIFLLSLAEKKSLLFFTGKEELRADALVTFTTQLAQLIKSNIPLYESLFSLQEQYREEKFHSLLVSLCDQIKEGSSLSQAMGQFPKSFDSLFCSMVAAGESAGILGETLEKLATLLTKQEKLKKQLLSALLYPLLLGSFSLLILFIMMTFVIPSMEAVFQEREVNGLTRIVISMSHIFTRYWAIYIPLFFGIIGGGIYYAKSPKGKRFLKEKSLKIPVLKSLLVQAATVRFTRTLASLLQGGVQMILALRIARNVMRHPVLEEVIENAEKRIIEGSSLSRELSKSPLMPPLVHRMCAVGEESGSLPAMLHKIADLYEIEVEKTLTRLTALLQPTILLIMAVFVGLIMMAVLLPLTDVSGFIQS